MTLSAKGNQIGQAFQEFPQVYLFPETMEVVFGCNKDVLLLFSG
jgi:hypothetical protein